VLVGHHLYLRRYWSNEQTIQSSLRHRLKTPKTTVPGLGLLLDTLFPREDKNPDWQRVACALASRSPFTLITGGPGTGKTRTVLRLLALLQAQRLDTDPDEPLRIRLAAPTGKAAARLSESISGEIDALPLPESVRAAIPREVTTLHRLLSPRPGSRLFRHDRHNPLHADLVVVDEASMIDQELTARLLDALRPETRLVLLGDKDQLASVEAGAVLGELCEGADSGQYTAETVAWVSEHSGDDISAWQPVAHRCCNILSNCARAGAFVAMAVSAPLPKQYGPAISIRPMPCSTVTNRALPA
jgi:DNA helicase/exodeoxyribonuclease V, alpha subunit (EC 3.1.11.5)